MKVEKTFNPIQNTKILENILEGWSSLTQEKLRISQSIFQHTLKDRASTNIKPVVLRKLFALQLIPKEITLPKTEGRNLVEVTEGLIRNLREAERRIVMEGVSTLNSTTNNNSNNSTAQENTRNQGRHLGVVSTEGSNTFRQAIRHPKEAEAKNLFNPSRLYAEGEKVYGFYSEEIHS
jgi:hypothetical protein